MISNVSQGGAVKPAPRRRTNGRARNNRDRGNRRHRTVGNNGNGKPVNILTVSPDRNAPRPGSRPILHRLSQMKHEEAVEQIYNELSNKVWGMDGNELINFAEDILYKKRGYFGHLFRQLVALDSSFVNANFILSILVHQLDTLCDQLGNRDGRKAWLKWTKANQLATQLRSSMKQPLETPDQAIIPK